jgi:hypothetical protein
LIQGNYGSEGTDHQSALPNAAATSATNTVVANNATSFVGVVADVPYGDATVPLLFYTFTSDAVTPLPSQLYVNRFNTAVSSAKQISAGTAAAAKGGAISGIKISNNRKFIVFGSQTTDAPVPPLLNTVHLFISPTDASTAPVKVTPATVTDKMSGGLNVGPVAFNNPPPPAPQIPTPFLTADSKYYVFKFTDETDVAQTKTSLWSATLETTPKVVNLTPVHNDTTGDPIGGADGFTVDCGVRALFYQTGAPNGLPTGAANNVFGIALAGGDTVRLGFEPQTGISVTGWKIAVSAFRIGFSANQFNGNDLYWNAAAAWMIAPSAFLAVVALIVAMF